MGLFGRQDELFEIMAKSSGKSLSSQSGPVSRSSSGSVSLSRSGGFGSSTLPRFGLNSHDMLEVDGDPLVVVDDEEWEASGAALEELEPALSLRPDTAAVGVVLLVGVVLTAFLLGRQTAAPEPAQPEPATVVVAEAPPAQQPQPSQPAPQQPAALLAAAPRQPTAGTSVPASAPRPQPNQPAQSNQPTGAAPQPKSDKAYDLLVVGAIPAKNAQQVADWFNQNAFSPIFGHPALEAYVKTSRNGNGQVRIRGFSQRNEAYLAKVRQVKDPTGGSRHFDDAYYMRVR